MKIPEEQLQRMKRATSAALRDAQAMGDPYAIAEAKRNDEFVDDLIRRNKGGGLTAGDIVRLGFLIERLVELLKDIDWRDVF
jgi:hypothetical protein